MHGVVIGPGLGREREAGRVLEKVLANCVCPVVIDADALWFVANSETVRGCIRARKGVTFLTPNVVEARRIETVVGKGGVPGDMGDVVVIRKGFEDVVTRVERGEEMCVCVGNEGSGKRVGGQGDLLAGCVALFAMWCREAVVAAVGACYVTREAGRRAFEKKGRGMLASDVLECIAGAVDSIAVYKGEHAGFS